MQYIEIDEIRIVTWLDYTSYKFDIEDILNRIIMDLLEVHKVVTISDSTYAVLTQDKDKLTVELHDFCKNYHEERVFDNFFRRDEYDTDMLTEEEQKFAEANHGEVYSFLKSKKLDVESYYDIAILGYLKAVKDYHRKKSARDFPFGAIAYRAMSDSVFKEWRSEGTQKRKLNHISSSLDANMVTEGKESNLYDVIADTRNVIEELETNEAIRALINTLSVKGKEILQLLLQGYSKMEVQKMCNIKRKAFNTEMQRIRESYIRILG